MRRLLCIFFVIVVCLLSIVSLAQSEIIFRPGPGLNDGTDIGSVNGGKDSWVRGDISGINYGAEPYMIGSPVSNCNSATFKAFIQFDLSTLPANVQQVFLGVTHFPNTDYCLSNCDADFYFYPVTEPWSETTLTYDNKPSEAAAVYGPINITFPNDFGNREYDITNIYRSWKDNSAPNHGLAIHSPTVGCNNAAVIFYAHSSDATDENNRPYLRVIPGCVAPPSGLISWWNGDGNANDIVGTNNGSLINGTSFASGKAGQAFSLDGVDDYVEIPHSESLNFGPTQPMSINLWVKRTSTSPVSTIFAKRPDCGAQVHYLLQWYEPGNWFVFGSTGAPANGVMTTADKLPLNTWTFISVAFDGSTVTMYINGTPVASHAMSFDPNTVPLTLGGEPSCGDFFGGLIDEIQIFNRALAAEEIAAIYNAGGGGICFTESFTLTVTKAGTGTGSVTPSTGALTWNSNTGTGIYSSGTLVTLTATADLGSVFEGWNGAGCSGTGDCIFTMTADTMVTVSFVPEILPLTPTEGTIGTELTVNGSGFGIKKGKVLIGGVATKIAKDGWKPDSITCTVTKVPPEGTHDVTIKPNKAADIPLFNAFTVKPPEIDSLNIYHGIAGAPITITGNFFSTKKGKVYLEDISTGKNKNCKVTSWGMDSITFVVPKGLVSGTAYPLKAINKVGIAVAPSNFTID